MKRGWFTYTDLCVLLEQSAWSQALAAIYQHFTKVRSLELHFFSLLHILNTCGVGSSCWDIKYPPFVFRFLACSDSSTWPAWLASSPPVLCCSSSAFPDTARLSCRQLTSAWPAHRPLTSAQKLRQQPSTTHVAWWRTKVWPVRPNHLQGTTFRIQHHRLHLPRICVSGDQSSLLWATYILRQNRRWKQKGLLPQNIVPALSRHSHRSTVVLETTQHFLFKGPLVTTNVMLWKLVLTLLSMFFHLSIWETAIPTIC